MTSRFSELVLDCHDPKLVAGFWCAALGYKIIEESDEVVEIGPEDMPDGWTPELIAKWKERMRGAPPAPTIVFAPVPESKTVKNRVHIDVSPLGSQEEEVERLIQLGATRADVGQGDVRWVVMRDPEDNEFCVLRSLAP
ncbi:MAG: VOC family protein [Actinobacteria bacterium]|nr:MAG: VOC family protein [Actinomycetota bacterium]